MKKWGWVSTAALAVALAAVPARAQESSGKYYIGLSGAAVYTDAAKSLQSIAGGYYDKDVPNGGKVYAGYVKDSGWGMEFAYYYLGTFDILTAPAGQVQDQLKTSAIVIAGVYQWQVYPGYDLIGRLGVAFTQAKYDCQLGCGTLPFIDTTERGTSGMWGVGLNMRMTQSFSFLLEYEHIGSVHHSVGNIGFKDGYDMYSVGVRLAF